MDGNINTLFNNLATDIRNVAVAVGVFAFMWGAVIYATSGGSPHQAEQGKTGMAGESRSGNMSGGGMNGFRRAGSPTSAARRPIR